MYVSRWRQQQGSRDDSPMSATFPNRPQTSHGTSNPINGHRHNDSTESTQEERFDTISPSSVWENGLSPQQPGSGSIRNGFHGSGMLRAMNLSDGTVTTTTAATDSEGDRRSSSFQSPPPTQPIRLPSIASFGSGPGMPPVPLRLSPPGDEAAYDDTVRPKRSLRRKALLVSALPATPQRNAFPVKRKQSGGVSSGPRATVKPAVAAKSNESSDEGDDSDSDKVDSEDPNELESERDEKNRVSKRRKVQSLRANAHKLPNPVPDNQVNKKPRGRIVAKDPAEVESSVVHVCPVKGCSACFKR